MAQRETLSALQETRAVIADTAETLATRSTQIAQYLRSAGADTRTVEAVETYQKTAAAVKDGTATTEQVTTMNRALETINADSKVAAEVKAELTQGTRILENAMAQRETLSALQETRTVIADTAETLATRSTQIAQDLRSAGADTRTVEAVETYQKTAAAVKDGTATTEQVTTMNRALETINADSKVASEIKAELQQGTRTLENAIAQRETLSALHDTRAVIADTAETLSTRSTQIAQELRTAGADTRTVEAVETYQKTATAVKEGTATTEQVTT